MWSIEKRRRLYSPECVEGKFLEVQMQDRALPWSYRVRNAPKLEPTHGSQHYMC
jgi:hypothetical protein